mgnify:CR=1 FL=1|jgi:hypothetical protein
MNRFQFHRSMHGVRTTNHPDLLATTEDRVGGINLCLQWTPGLCDDPGNGGPACRENGQSGPRLALFAPGIYGEYNRAATRAIVRVIKWIGPIPHATNILRRVYY